MVAEELVVEINAKVDRAVKDMQSMQKQTQSAATQMKNFVKQVAGIGGAAVIATKALGALKKFIGDSIQAASDAEEIGSKFDAVFKNNSKAVRQWAREYSNAIGRSQTENLAFLATIQDTLVPLGVARDEAADMSKTVVQLATDLASFNNLPTEQVIRDIQSAMVGNTETIRKYGVVANQVQIEQEALNSGIWDGEGAITGQEKALAILNLTMKGTKDAQGDAIRTADSFANVSKRLTSQIKELQENVGKELTPGLGLLKKALADTLQVYNQFNRANREAKNVIEEVEATGRDLTLDDKIALYNQQIAQANLSLEQMRKSGGAIAEKLGIQNKHAERIKAFIEDQKDKLEEVKSLQEDINSELEDEIYNRSLAVAVVSDLLTPAELENLKAKKAVTDQVKATEEQVKNLVEVEKAGLIDRIELNEQAIEARQNLIDQLIEQATEEGEVSQATIDAVNEQLEYIALYEEAIEELTEKIKEEAEERKEAIRELYNYNESREIQLTGTFAEQHNERHSIIASTLKKDNDSLEDWHKKQRDIIKNISSMTTNSFGDMGSLIDMYYQNQIDAAEDNSEKQKELMRKQAEAQKAIALFQAAITIPEMAINAYNSVVAIPGVGPAVAAVAAAAATAFGLAKFGLIAGQPIPEFREGGEFITDRPQLIQVGDNPSGRERVSIEPLDGNQGGGEMLNVQVYVGDELLYNKITQASRNGQIVIDARSIR